MRFVLVTDSENVLMKTCKIGFHFKEYAKNSVLTAIRD